MVINGSFYGPGIYLASNSATSLSYSSFGHNLWPNSLIEKDFNVIALCEIIIDVMVKNAFTGKMETKTLEGSLKDKSGCFTLTMEEACIVRFVFTNFQQSVESKPNEIPTFDQIVDKLIEENSKDPS